MANEIKRHFYNHKDYLVDFENRQVILSKAFFSKLKSKKLWGKRGFKKVGGSLLGNVLKLDRFKSDFAAFCHIAWIGLPILDRKYVEAGIVIEPKVVSQLQKFIKKSIETFDPRQYDYDYFASKDDVLGGLPDGFIRETKTIIEIKTTGEKNFANWKRYGVPTPYLRQAQLYAYLMDVSKYSIVATFLKEEDYANPHNYPVHERVMKNWNYLVNKAQVKDDIAYVKKWYHKHTAIGISPPYDETNDAYLLEWLKCSSKAEWEALKTKWINEGKLVI